MKPILRIEVVHAVPTRQTAVTVDVPEGATVRDAVLASGIVEAAGLATVDLDHVGIWNRVATPDTVLSDGDRVELHRPLTADPKEARRRRARPFRAT